MRNTTRSPRSVLTRRVTAAVTVAVAVATVLAVGPAVAGAQPAPPDGAPDASVVAAAAPVEVPFAPVLERVVAGDLVMAANSNVLAAGGWRRPGSAQADVDGDQSRLCIGRTYVPAACADNSSSASLDIPPGARVVAARLYVDTSVTAAVGPLRVRLDGPAEGYDYTELGAATPGILKLYEASGGGRASTIVRQAVWDVTDYVGAAGPGSYTVADIVHERSGAWLPYASWAIVAAYELDPSTEVRLTDLPPETQARFAPRALSWFDGFLVRSEGSIDVQVGGYQVTAGAPVFAKTFHIVAHAQARAADNILFAGGPLGNNHTPGNGAPPVGVVVGADPACNSTTDVFNDSICVLGTAVAAKSPGPTAYRASGDGVTPTSGSAVDMDVTRVPDRYLAAGTTSATLSVQAVGGDPIAPGMLAASVDLAPVPAQPAAVADP